MDPRTSAQDVMRCDLCETAVVQMHCDTCLVNLCTSCVGKHMISDESKKHEIVRITLRKSTVLYPECASHIKGRCEIYCNQCDIPICATCVASGQHLSHKLLKILQVLPEKREQIIKKQIELNETIYPTYQDIASDIQSRMGQLEEEYKDLSTAITKHEEDWQRKFDKLVKKLKAEVDEMKKKQLNSLQKQLDETNITISDIKDEINSMETLVDSNDISKIINVTSDIERYKNLPKKFVPFSPTFTPGEIQENELRKMFGALSSSFLTSKEDGYRMKTTQKLPEAGSSPPVKQLLDEPETVTAINTGYENLLNVACLNDEEIWTSGTDDIMKLFSINQGSLLKSITTKSGYMPWDIAVTKSGDLVYTDHIDKTVNIVKNERIEKVIRLQNWSPYSVCITSSFDLLIIMYSVRDKQSKVVRYSGSKEKQSIQFDDKGKPLCSTGFYYRHIAENRNLDICVSDNRAEAVVVVNQAGKLRFRYTGHTPAPKNEPFSPRGITTDSQSHILMTDDNLVHIIDQDGQFLRYINCELNEPMGLCIDTNDNLFVAEYRNRQVKKIKYQL